MQRRHDTPFFATLSGALDQLRARLPELDESVRADGERILITGGTRGLGLALAKDLVRRGADVVLLGRSGLRAAEEAVRAARQGARVDVHGVDLTEVDAVERVLGELGGFDRVVLNAGAVPSSSHVTSSGLDLMVHLHVVANAQLVRGLRRRHALPDGARVVIVGSEAHRKAAFLDDWQTPTTYGTAGVLEMYGQSKRLLHTWAEALKREAPELEVVHLCPGGMATDIAREAPASLRWAVNPAMRLLFPAPDEVAGSVSWALLSPHLVGRSGTYLHLGVEKEPGEGVRDAERGRRLWTEIEALLERWTDGA